MNKENKLNSQLEHSAATMCLALARLAIDTHESKSVTSCPNGSIDVMMLS
jgi:hypothetical protein